MKHSEVADLLTLAAAYDRRTIGDADVLAWYELMKDIDLADARDAVVDHYRDQTTWIMPAHILAAVKRVRSERLRVFGGDVGVQRILSPAHRDHWEWLADVKALHQLVGSGKVTRSTPPEEALAAVAAVRASRELPAGGWGP